jgi:hypothetical protein
LHQDLHLVALLAPARRRAAAAAGSRQQHGRVLDMHIAVAFGSRLGFLQTGFLQHYLNNAKQELRSH